jgi:SAM-dependent methyltransferase
MQWYEGKLMSSDPIYQFYTQHPYPPPIDNLDRAREVYKDENVLRAEFHLFWPDREYRADLDVLVAGCGTWQSAKYAICHPAARVTAIDVSPTSLEHTEALKRKYNLTNLEPRLLPIEKVAELGRQFDHIVCTGVLHHLADPDAGLRALAPMLKPDGAMYLMVYAPYGRTGVHMIQEYCRRLGVGTSPQEVNDLTKVLREVPPHHPVLSMMRGAREGLNADALIDALLNPRDRTYSVPQLYEFLEGADLIFGRWYWQATYSPQCGSYSATPHAARLAALPEPEQYAAMELWRGMITNHDLVAHGKGIKDHAARVGFDGEQFLRYVPLRRPWTICVQERLPPGAAGALLNQTHMFNDLYLLVDAKEKQIFDGIDGRRTVGEILETTGTTGMASSPAEFFRNLWLYDQVVFDTSKAL